MENLYMHFRERDNSMWSDPVKAIFYHLLYSFIITQMISFEATDYFIPVI